MMKAHTFYVALLMALLVIKLESAPAPLPAHLPADLITPLEQSRPADQSFLTVPEWFLVFSPEEYAQSLRLKTRHPSAFPFFTHIGQFWQSYYFSTLQTDSLSANSGYHVMDIVIGVSTSVEYMLKGTYENIIGRFTELAAGQADTAEDRLAAKTAHDYVDFIKIRPWYEFDFITPVKTLWTQQPVGDDNLIRRWERRYVLTSEYLIKAGYAKLLALASNSSYAAPIERTYALVKTPTDIRAPSLPADTKIVRHLGTYWLLDMPRRQAFQDAAITLAHSGYDFETIAGNRKEILVTFVGSHQAPEGGREIFRQAIITKPDLTRFAIAYPIAELARALRRAEHTQGYVEHIYDF
jgi:hypothetical protein